MAVPTADAIRENSLVDFDSLGYTGTKLDRLVSIAVSQTRQATGQGWANTGEFTPVAPLSSMDEPLVDHVVQTLTEWLAYRTQPDVVETLGDFDLISSFSAGAYSETRRGGKDALEAQRAFLRGLFWGIMSPDKQDDWIAAEEGAAHPPSFAVTEVDWSGAVGHSYQDQYGNALPGTDTPYPTHEVWR